MDDGLRAVRARLLPSATTRSWVPARSPGSLAGNPPPRWGAPGDDLARAARARASAGFARRRSPDEEVRHVQHRTRRGGSTRRRAPGRSQARGPAARVERALSSRL